MSGQAGAPEGREIQAITTAGLSGGFIAGDDLDITIDEPSFQKVGAMLGAAGIMVFDDTRDMVDVARNAMEFFAEESCGKCFPCRIGTQRLTELLSVPLGPEFGNPHLRDWSSDESDERVRSRYRCTKHYGQSDKVFLLMADGYFENVESRVYSSLRYCICCRLGDGPGTDAISCLRGNDFRRDCAIPQHCCEHCRSDSAVFQH